jgi:two-component system chemotaxis response regulator CheY
MMNDQTFDVCRDDRTRPEGVLEVPRLLVIEDDPIQRTLIVRAAEKAGYRTVAVKSCLEAIEQLKTQQFSCLTLDLTLEDGEGFDVMWQMANAGRRVPIIVISGMDAQSRRTCRSRIKELGIEILQSFPKPVDLAALRISLANLVSANAGLPNLHWLGEIRISEET